MRTRYCPDLSDGTATELGGVPIMKTRMIGLALAFVLLTISAPAVHAVWIPNGTAVCWDLGHQRYSYIVEDGAGGGFMVWEDDRSGNLDVYAQRIDADGNIMWTASSVPVCTSSGDQMRPTLVSDGAGGVIVVWYDRRSGSHYDAYAQRLDSAGNILWAVNGVPFCTAAGDQLRTLPISDGAGGAIVSWYDGRIGSYDVYAQRIDPTGSVLWASDGVAVCSATGNQEWPRITVDGSGGAIIAWYDSRSGDYDIYSQRVDDSGAMLWAADGVPLCGASGDQFVRTIVSGGGSGGAIVFWEDRRAGNLDIYGQKIDADGLALWTADGLAVCTTSGDQDWATAVTDGAGGAIVAWRDYRTPSNDRDLYIQKTGSDGTLLWENDGKPMCVTSWLQQNIHMIPDGAGGVMATWRDQRWGTSYGSHIYAQGYDSSGNPCFDINGAVVSDSPLTQSLGHLCPAGEGKAIISWYDNRAYFNEYEILIDNYDIYALLVDFGDVDPPPDEMPPSILAVDDVPMDQGGRLSIQWSRSDLDVQPDMEITHYTMWRRLPLAESPLALSSTDSLSSLGTSKGDRPFIIGAEVPIDHDGTAWRFDLADGEYAWEYISEAPAMGYEHYALTVESLYDSMAGSINWQYFMVVAHTGNPGVFYESAVDSGYSVDNLSPHVPCGITAVRLGPPECLIIAWEPNTDPDIGLYRLYRSEGSDFVPGPGNMLLETADTQASDPECVIGSAYYYRLSALDVHGNEGPSVLITPEQVTATLLQSFSAMLEERVVKVRWQLHMIDEGAEFSVLRSENQGGGYAELPSVEISRDGLSFEFTDRDVSSGADYFYRVKLILGSESSVLFETERVSVPPAALALHQNHPNPFNPATTIRYFLPSAGHVRLTIYDVSGRLITTLVDGARAEGEHSTEWDGGNGSAGASSGVYFYRLDYGKESITKKMILLR